MFHLYLHASVIQSPILTEQMLNNGYEKKMTYLKLLIPHQLYLNPGFFLSLNKWGLWKKGFTTAFLRRLWFLDWKTFGNYCDKGHVSLWSFITSIKLKPSLKYGKKKVKDCCIAVIVMFLYSRFSQLSLFKRLS